MVQFFRNLKHGIHNLIIWFPIIWKIRYWDYEYGVDLFIKYLKHLREGINKQAYEDGSNLLSFCEFFYGDDNGESLIEAHN